MKGSDVREIRTKAELSQSQFCEQYGLNVFTLRQWERKDTVLDATASAYLKCIARNGDMITKLLAEGKKSKK